jgi:hypothetical protein
MASRIKDREIAGVSAYALALRQMLQARASKLVATFPVGDLSVEVRVSSDAVWAIIRREGRGGLALRAAHIIGAFECATSPCTAGEAARLTITSPAGEHVVTFRTGSDALDQLRMTVRFTPSMPMLIPFMPRDLYPLDANDDPLGSKVVVAARQRGVNSGVLYFRLEKPAFGNVLYFQNFTELNGYYSATKTTPEDTVGGAWPELGHRIPVPEPDDTGPAHPLPAGVPVTLSDAILVFRPDAPPHERESARQFLQMLGTTYKMLDLPKVIYRDWVERAERTLRDLDAAPEATIEHYGHRYIHPYTAAEYPDIMVQMSVVTAIHDWGKWSGASHPLEAELKAGVAKFYDPELKSLRRYLPNVGDDKDADAVDSWYLYHPMLNLGILALDGDEDARAMLMKSVEFGIKAAHHFEYKWPVQYKITDFSVITKTAEADGHGQTDVGGIYAWVMLQMFELTDDKRYLDEARAAIDAAIGLRFNVNYQANLTAWGAAACVRLWRITNEAVYLEQSYVYLASFFHNCEIWESEIELARHYSNFLGVTCLQDAPYMAIYECFDSFVAFEHYLRDSGPDLEPAARMLISEFCRYALHRGWFYYPDALPPEAISPKQREANGHIDRNLSFPVEDLYANGQPAGQVGQEVYGAGAALIFATRMFHPVDGAPFRLYCDHLLRAIERTGEKVLTITLDGGETCTAALSLIRLKRRKLGKIRVSSAGGDVIRAHHTSADRAAFHVPASGRLIITWE